MACQCGKGRVAPLGSKNNPKSKKAQDDGKGVSVPTMSPAKGREQKFTLETRDGKTLTFGSALEARAERKRRGGGTLRF